MAKQRPTVVHGKTPKVVTGCGSMYLTLNKWDGVLKEIRVYIGKKGTCQNLLLSCLAMYMSMAFQNSEEDPESLHKNVVDHLLGGVCGTPFNIKNKKYESCIDYIAQICMKEFKIAQRVEKTKKKRQEKKEQEKPTQ